MATIDSLTETSSFDEVAEAIIKESVRRGYDRPAAIANLSTAIQESYLDPRAVSKNGLWVGLYQQDSGYPGRYVAKTQVSAFLDRLDAKRKSTGAAKDPWLNIFWLQQRPSEPSADVAYRNGRQAYLQEIKRHIDKAAGFFDRFGGGAVQVAATSDRPDFNEYPIWSPNCSGRNGARIDLFLLHTQEGNSNADGLAQWMSQPSSQVSYHYSISQDNRDNGVTVVDVVDTDLASWSVLSANPRSINLVFAGSKASWTRQDWLKYAGRSIDVAAYLAAQDCEKYSIQKRVLKPPYSAPGGVSDHRYVTQFLRDGTHTDVGGPMKPPWTGFPWDVFESAFLKYSGQAATKVQEPPKPVIPVGPATDQLTLRWNSLGGQTIVEALAEVRDKVLGTSDRGKTGVK
jgi:hypothetical protein